ncbi:hypothetical protein [Taklimakanibacter albus]|uniref:Uncharacterized protein n=1 Tax=Taklimakanibacter albus TaxID=2800327 RepID=A0ACC5R6G5_9HYPH|nr:hypothetical protein [Aestuariivirga sp. YIM B02566]MBK1868239.1 hypothetical protein [Aestuariivirga sp. YIM B02566]
MADLLGIYVGSDGAATKALYDTLDRLGPKGQIATHLFRAHKNSSKAKEYRRHGRSAAYATKDWAITSLTNLLTMHGHQLGLNWGWGVDLKQEFHRDVFYLDLPTGQVSFHTVGRGKGPDYPGTWDGVREQGSMRICKWVLNDVFVGIKADE